MEEHTESGHWIPQAIGAAGVALAVLVQSLDAFGFTAPGIGRWQAVSMVVAGVVVGAGLVLHVLDRQGRIRFPDWRLPSDRPSAHGVLLLPIWFGLLAGLLDPHLLYIQRLVGMRFIYINPHVSWMSPLSYSAFFLVALVLLRLPGRGHWRWLRSVRAMGTVLSFLALLSLLLLFHPELHLAAALLLAAGVAAQVFRLLRTRSVAFERLVIRSAPLLAACVALAAGVHLGLPAVREARLLAKLPSARPGAPNFLLVILDTVRGANVSFNGYARPTTPNLERFFAGGVVFETGIATSSWSAPSHASVVTGRYPFDLAVDWLAPLSSRYPTVAERLAANGYVTAGFIANKIYAGSHTGIGRGAIHWDADDVSLEAVLGASMIGLMVVDPGRLAHPVANANTWSDKSAPTINAEFLDWLDRRSDRPFFAMLNYFDAHSPYDGSPPPFDGMFGPHDRPQLPVNPRLASEALTRDLDGYDRSIAYLDDQVGRLLDELEDRGILDRTVVILTSDHGEEFGEKRQVSHGRSLNFAVLHVPLAIRGPGVDPGVRVADPVSIRDIPATIIDLAGTAEPALPGASLRRYWRPAAPGARDTAGSFVFAALSGRGWLPDDGERRAGNMLAAFSGRLRYGRYGEPADESLFDIASDPWEQHDLSGLPQYAAVLARFRAATDPIARDFMDRDPLER